MQPVAATYRYSVAPRIRALIYRRVVITLAARSPGADRMLNRVMSRAASSPKPKRIRRKPEQAEREILDTAEGFLRDHDFRELTIDEVMARTGMVRSASTTTFVIATS